MISAFEYVTVLISIILGLGITQILTGVANLYHKMERVKFYWPHALWVVFVLILQIQDWWLTYEIKGYTPWRLLTFLFVMLYPINLFILARMLFPATFRGKIIDLKVFYFENYKKIFFLLIVSAVLSIAYDLFILDLKFYSQILQALLVLIFSVVVLKDYKQEWIHKTLAIGMIVIFFTVAIVERDKWLIN